MEMEITLPDDVPVMTLRDVAFFPQVVMPLRIFEPRYRQMLRDVLRTNRLLAVAGLDTQGLMASALAEPPHRVATVGLIRACQKNEDGTSDLLLQGISRIEVLAIVRDQPYRRVKVRALTSKPGGTLSENQALRRDLARLINEKRKLTESISDAIAALLKTVDDPEVFVDIAAFNLCEDVAFQQKLLETLDVRRRLKLFGQRLRSEIEELRLECRLQGKLPDDQIQLN
jgi:Lon protease-like protein